MDVAALVFATGSERGLSSSGPDALCPLGGVPLVAHVVRTLRRSGSVGAVVVLVPPGSGGEVRRALDLHVPGHWAVIVDGRDPDVLVEACGAAGVVVVFDVWRPLSPPELVGRVVAAMRRGADVAVPAVPFAETVKELDPGGWIVRTVARETLRQVQAPWALRTDHRADQWADRLAGLLTPAGVVDAGPAWLLSPGCRVETVPGHPDAFGLRTRADLELASAVLRARLATESRTAPGGGTSLRPTAFEHDEL